MGRNRVRLIPKGKTSNGVKLRIKYTKCEKNKKGENNGRVN